LRYLINKIMPLSEKSPPELAIFEGVLNFRVGYRRGERGTRTGIRGQGSGVSFYGNIPLQFLTIDPCTPALT
jgi:hypothetical protein